MTNAIPGERETWRDGVETRMLVAAKNGARELCIFEQWVAPGNGAPTHFHQVEEVLTVLAGEAEVWVDDQALPVAGRAIGDRAGAQPPRLQQHRKGTPARPRRAGVGIFRSEL